MAFVEGGPFQCDSTGFSSPSIEEWNNHCMNDCNLHTEMGTTACRICGVVVEYSNLPFHPLSLIDGSKGISLTCPDCDAKTTGNVQKNILEV